MIGGVHPPEMRVSLGARVLACDFSRVDAPATPRDRLEAHHVAIKLHDHETLFGVEALGGQVAGANVARAQLGGATGGEIVDAALRLDPLVEMLVAREDDG